MVQVQPSLYSHMGLHGPGTPEALCTVGSLQNKTPKVGDPSPALAKETSESESHPSSPEAAGPTVLALAALE